MSISLGTIYGSVNLRLEALNASASKAEGVFGHVQSSLKNLSERLGGHKEAAEKAGKAAAKMGDATEKAGKQTGEAGKKTHEASGFLHQFRERALRVIEVMGVVEGVKLGFDFLKEAIGGSLEEAARGQDVFTQLQSVLESTSGAAGVTVSHATALADSFGRLTKFDHETVLSAENMLLTFTNIGAKGGVFDQATQTTLDMAQALGEDTSSAAMQLGKALNDPVKGVTALRRVGVQLSDDQLKLVKHFMAVNDIASAQKIILGELGREFGGSAKAAGQTFSGQMVRLQHAFKDVQETIGMALMPVLSALMERAQPLVEQLGKVLPGALEALGTIFRVNVLPVLNQFMDAGERLLPKLLPVGQFLLAILGPTLQTIGNLVKAIPPVLLSLGAHFAAAFGGDKHGKAVNIRDVVKQVFDRIHELGTWAQANLVPILNQVASVVGFLAGKFIDLIGWLNTHREVLAAVGIALGIVGGIILATMVPAMIAWAISAGSAAIANALLFAPIIAVVAGIALLALGIIELVKHWGQISKAIGDFLGGAGKAIGGFFSGLGKTVHNALTAVMTTIQGWLRGLGDFIGHAFHLYIDLITLPIRLIVGAFKWLFEHNYFFHNLVKNIMAVFEWLRDTALGLWHKFIGNLALIWAAIQAVAQAAWKLVQDHIIKPVEHAVGWVLAKFEEFKTRIRMAFMVVVVEAQSLWKRIQDAFSNGVKAVMDFVHDHYIKPIQDLLNLGEKAFKWGQNLIEGFLNGLGSMKDKLVAKVKDVLGGLAKVLGFHSPAEEGPGADADTWSPNLMRMYAGGIERHRVTVRNAAQGVADDLRATLAGGMVVRNVGSLAPLNVRSAATSALGGSGGGGARHTTVNLTVTVEHDASDTGASPAQTGERFGRSAGNALAAMLDQDGYNN